jgi:hypothetical protein
MFRYWIEILAATSGRGFEGSAAIAGLETHNGEHHNLEDEWLKTRLSVLLATGAISRATELK